MKASTLQKKTKAELIEMLLNYEKKVLTSEQQLSDLTLKLQQFESVNDSAEPTVAPTVESDTETELETNRGVESLKSVLSKEQKESIKAELEVELRTRLLTQPNGEPTPLNLALQTGIQVLPTVRNFMNGVLIVKSADGTVHEMKFTDAVRHMAGFLYNESPDAFEFRG